MDLMSAILGLGQLGLGAAGFFGGGGEEMSTKTPQGYKSLVKHLREYMQDAYGKLYGQAPFTFQGQQLGYRTPQARSASDVFKTAAGNLTGAVSGAQGATASQNIAKAQMDAEDNSMMQMFPLMMALQSLQKDTGVKNSLASLLGMPEADQGSAGKVGGLSRGQANNPYSYLFGYQPGSLGGY